MLRCSAAGCTKAGGGQCSTCEVFYCGVECQARDWPRHKPHCTLPPPQLVWLVPPPPSQQQEELKAFQVMDKPAIVCPDMAVSSLEKGKLYDIASVEHFESTSEFSIRLLMETSRCQGLMELMSSNPPDPPSQTWQMRLGGAVSVRVKGSWYRGVYVRKVGPLFFIYLVDFGFQVNVRQDDLRPLIESLLDVHPFAYQVCLSGVGPSDTNRRTEIKKVFMDSPGMKVEFLRQLMGGRWLVRIKSQNDQRDLATMFLDWKLCVTKIDPPSNFSENKIKKEAMEDVGEVKEVQELKVVEEVIGVRGSVVPRGVLPEEGVERAGVCHMTDSPDTFYICPSDKIDLYTQIRRKAQSVSLPGRVEPVLGSCCLARHGPEFFRAEITGVSPDQTKVSLFLIDFGMNLTEEVANLKPLPEELSSEPGLVMKVTLRGVRPSEETWSDAERDACLMLLDAGGNSTYNFYDVNYVEDMCFVNAEDSQGNDVASLMVETEAAAADNLVGVQLTATVLERGLQELLIVSVVSPVEFYLSKKENFLEISSSISSLANKVAESGDFVHPVIVGDLVLALRNGKWNRAKIVATLPDNFFTVHLFDLAETAEVELNDLCKATRDLMEFPVLVTKCALHSFQGREKEADKVKEKMKSLMRVYETVQVEVRDDEDGLTMVRLPDVERKLTETEVNLTSPSSSRQELIRKLKLKRGQHQPSNIEN